MKGLNLPKKRIYLGPASLIRRILAFVLDLFVIDIVIAGFFKGKISLMLPEAAGFSEVQTIMQSSQALIAQLSSIILAISLISLLYFSVMQAVLSQTVGMMVLNIYVMQQGKKIAAPTFWQGIIRNIFVFPFFPFFVLWLTEPLFLIFSRSRMRMLEVLSKTVTVEEISE
ncbi:RDD family protein [Candidatus Woesearchaeota archaeon]|nr:RDD family protein [Candidatus Woesearchaeota archaeon]